MELNAFITSFHCFQAYSKKNVKIELKNCKFGLSKIKQFWWILSKHELLPILTCRTCNSATQKLSAPAPATARNLLFWWLQLATATAYFPLFRSKASHKNMILENESKFRPCWSYTTWVLFRLLTRMSSFWLFGPSWSSEKNIIEEYNQVQS